MGSILFALGAALSWGSADFLGGITSRKLGTLGVLFVSQIIAVSLFALVVVVTGTSIPWNGEFFAFAVVAGAVEAIGLAAFYRGLAVGSIGVVAPISACSAVVPVAFGLASGERLGGVELGGVLLALGGVLILGWESGEKGERGKVAAGVGLALVAALGIGGFFVVIAYAVERADPLAAVLVSRITLVLGVTVAVVIRGRVGAVRPAIGLLALIGALDIGGSTLYAAATAHGLVAIIGVIAALYPITTVALARVVSGERLALAQRLGAAAGLAGVALVASVQ